MKRSDLRHLIHPDVSRDEARRLLFECGINNFYQEAEMDSPLVDTHMDISYTSDYVSQHSHTFYEVIYCVQGELEYLLGIRRYQVQSGDIIIAPPGVIHCPILPKDMIIPYKRYVLWISAYFAETLRNASGEILDSQEATVLRTTGTKWEYLKRYFTRGVKESEAKAPGWQVCLGGIATQLLVHIARASHELATVPTNLKEDLLEQILEYVQNNLKEKLSVAQTAQNFHISQSTLTHLFHREMGISFYRCVIQRRLAEGKNLIARGMTMEEVSLTVGFQEYSAFYRAFKSEYGISPIQYRKMLRESQ